MDEFGLADIRATASLIAPHIAKTPVFDWCGRELAARRGHAISVSLKLELFQFSGSFKARGALSNMMRLDLASFERGVTAVSAGNHAVATAYAAQALGTHAKVVMLASANPARVDQAKAYGAEILTVSSGEEGFALAEQIVATEKRTFVHPFEGRGTALGSATIGLEWLDQVKDLDAVIVAIGGGGLCGGLSRAIKLLQPGCAVFGVEPTGADTMRRSILAGAPVNRLPDQQTIADSLAPPFALPYSFGLCREHVDQIVTVSDEEMRDAVGLLFREMKLAVEPAGAAALAALLGPLRAQLPGARVGLLICGANIDARSFAALIGA